ncbi:MAG TPA: glutathione synthase [Gammaproteobacteria bacterium]|jgi:glutathione synthase|nr:glutathione synthase [Gammaproteobacteria bacterium]
MVVKLGVVMDAIAEIDYDTDSTFAMLLEAQGRGWDLHYFEQSAIFLRDGVPCGNGHRLTVYQDAAHWFDLAAQKTLRLDELDVILMRKDPPVNQNYIYTTYLLERAERLGVLVVNRPQALRDCNEKIFAADFPQCTPPTLVTQSVEMLHDFWERYCDIVCKPLDGMGGFSVFRVSAGDANAPVIFDKLTQQGQCCIMAQQFIPAISEGDKRILLVDGKPVDVALARMPQPGDWRGNLAVGAKGVLQPLSERDRWICSQLSPVLRERGLYFVGIDVIGDYLTEINVTSPTGIREIEAGSDCRVARELIDFIDSKCS